MLEKGNLKRCMDPEEGAFVSELTEEAKSFVHRIPWCKKVKDCHFFWGSEDLFAVFLFEVATTIAGDRELWIIVGDVPPAIMFVEHYPSGREAVEGYADNLEDWSRRVFAGEDLADCMPVLYRNSYKDVEPTPEYADLVARRGKFLREHILPLIDM
jgi:hypothetical protein